MTSATIIPGTKFQKVYASLIDDNNDTISGMKRFPTTGTATLAITGGSATTTINLNFNNVIRHFMIKPVNETDVYNWEIYEDVLPNMKIQKSKSNTGSLSYLTEFPIVGTAVLKITSASVNGDYGYAMIYE